MALTNVATASAYSYCGWSVAAHNSCSWVVTDVTAKYNLARVGNTTVTCEKVTHHTAAEEQLSRRCRSGSASSYDDLLNEYAAGWHMNLYVGNDDDFSQTIYGTGTF